MLNPRSHIAIGVAVLSVTLEQALKRKLAQQTAIEERLRAREGDAFQLLSAEQARWVDLNSKLDELEHFLAPVR